MRCFKAHAYLLDAAEGTLPDALQANLDAHLGACGACRERLEFVRKSAASLKRTPQIPVPQAVWGRIDDAIKRGEAVAESSARWKRWLEEMLDDLSWGRKVAFSSALAAVLVVLTVFGIVDIRRHPALPVVELTGNAINAYPAYFREHHRPSGQPVSDGNMVLAFNTLGDSD